MAGAFADRGLSCAVATPEDDAELRALLRSVATSGQVSLRFEREPDYFAGENIGGAEDTTIVVRRAGRIVCMGRCSRRTLRVGGVVREVGYLGELRLAPGTSGGAEILRAGYSFFAKLEAERPSGPAEIYFTSLASDNARARRVLVGGRLGLPPYESWRSLRTFLWPVSGIGVRSEETTEGERVDVEELTDFLRVQSRRFGLSSPWESEHSLRLLARHGLLPEHFRVMRISGQIVAAAALWDQSAWRQVVVAGYGGALRWARPGVNFLRRLGGLPGLPRPGGRLCQASLHPLALAAGHEEALPGLVEKIEQLARARSIDWLSITLDARDPLAGQFARRRGARSYATELFRVTLPGRHTSVRLADSELLRPEAGLL